MARIFHSPPLSPSIRNRKCARGKKYKAFGFGGKAQWGTKEKRTGKGTV